MNRDTNPYAPSAENELTAQRVNRYLWWFVVATLIGMYTALGLRHGPLRMLSEVLGDPIGFLSFSVVFGMIASLVSLIGYDRSGLASRRPSIRLRFLGGLVFGMAAVFSEDAFRWATDTIVGLGFLRSPEYRLLIFPCLIAIAAIFSALCETVARHIYISRAITHEQIR